MDKIQNIFFEFAFVRQTSDPVTLSAASQVSGMEDHYAHRYAQAVVAECCREGIEAEILLEQTMPACVCAVAGNAFAEHEESYALVVQRSKINLYAPNPRGMLYAVSTLKQLLEANALSDMVLFDYPDKDIRCNRVFLPGEESIDAFKQVVDKLVYYKYNQIMIEVGGAMEYKRHPEINAKWVEFCKEVKRTPYEAHRIHCETYPQWRKNSIHSDNGGGSYLSQEQVRQLIAYCRERELEVIPEVPTLSHCDYIVMAHPEINERVEDTYPDTYCPSNPRSYKLVFDILDEVIQVFQPRYINIGHDECYTLAKCPLCRDKDPVELYVADIVKINDYLKARGIRAMMWAEKFFDNIYLEDEDGKVYGFGGTGDPERDVPRLVGCAGKVPTDVILLHWYWSLCDGAAEQHLRDLGYEMLLANFEGANLKDYRARISGSAGGVVSNWGSFEEEYMQRNAQNFKLLSTAWTFLNRDYDTPQQEHLRQKVKNELYTQYKRGLGGHILELLHTTTHERPYKAFYDGYFIVPEDWKIGDHIVTYTDGTQIALPIIFGYNIRTASEVAITDTGSTESKATGYVEVIGASYPLVMDGRMFYKAAYANPYPQKQILSIHCAANQGIEIEAHYDL